MDLSVIYGQQKIKQFGFNASAFGQFIKRNFPKLHKQHLKRMRQAGQAE